MQPDAQRASPPEERKGVFVKDTVSALLYYAPCQAIIPLANFIAAKRLDAPEILLGLMLTGAYIGPLWNLFFSRITARVSLGKSVVLAMGASAVFVVLAGFQTSAVPYTLLILAFLVFMGLSNVQYTTMIQHLYPPETRQRRLSLRYFSLSIMAAVLSFVYGSISVRNYRSISLISGVLFLLAALVFNSLRDGNEHRMLPFQTRDVLGVLRRDRDLRLAVIVLSLYGIVGAGLNAQLSVLYTGLGYTEDTVGILSGIRVVGTIVAAAFITPRLAFPGGIRNFRSAFTAALASVSLYWVVAVAGPFPAGIVLLSLANFAFGIAVSNFMVAIQTTAIQLAPEGKTTLYVNAQMIVFGLRGLFWPFAVGLLLQTVSLVPTLSLSVVATLGCAAITWSSYSKLKGDTDHAV
jgi:hypothetical protein